MSMEFTQTPGRQRCIGLCPQGNRAASSPKGPIFKVTTITTRDKRRHAHLRRIFQPSFNSTALNACEPTVKQYCAKLVSTVHRISERDQIVDMCDWFNRFMFDVKYWRSPLMLVDRHSHRISRIWRIGK